jgi:NADP-dependent 3-hydroxy acid dehydrogenase YdfG
MSEDRGIAVVTGASSGIGAAAVSRLAAAGFRVVCGARRMDRLREVAGASGAQAIRLDVTDPASVAAFAAAVPECRLLVNNAGGALGLEAVAQADEAHWRGMWESNVLGLMRMTRALLPRLEASGGGHVINIGSIAGSRPTPGRRIHRREARGARDLADAAPRAERQARARDRDRSGLVETEFSIVRLGDAEKARRVYEGMTPLTADDVADCIAWAATRPWHVNIDEIVVRPIAQARAAVVARGQGL